MNSRRQQRRAQAPPWQVQTLGQNPIYADLVQQFGTFFTNHWPQAEDFNQWALQLGRQFSPQHPAQAGMPLRFSQQAQSYSALEFEQSIYQHGLIPCRREDWHDLFNALMWLSFPLTKSALNQIHVERGASQALEHANSRCPLRNFATLVDEAGVIIAYADPAETLSHQQHQWFQLFVEQREQWWQCRRPVIIGHGVYEQVLTPYLGLTAKAWYWPVPQSFFSAPLADQYGYLDQALAQHLGDLLLGDGNHALPRLLPLPLLGIPDWYGDNQDPHFYHNQDYFRPLPKQRR